MIAGVFFFGCVIGAVAMALWINWLDRLAFRSIG